MARRRRTRMLTTFAEAVDYLGGDTAVADWLGTDQRHIATMKCRGQPSRGVLLHFYLTLKQRRVEFAPSVFGVQSFDRLVMPRALRRASRVANKKA